MNKTEITDTVGTAFFELKSRKMRTFLTMLGIIVGIGSFIFVSSIGKGKSEVLQELFYHLGKGCLMLELNKNYNGNYPVTEINHFNMKDIQKIKEFPGIEFITPMQFINPRYLKVLNRNGNELQKNSYIEFMANSPETYKIAKFKLLYGRLYSLNEANFYTVIGNEMAKVLFGSAKNALNKHIRLSVNAPNDYHGLYNFTIIGVIKNPYVNSDFGQNNWMRYLMYTPIKPYMKITGNSSIPMIICRIKANANIKKVQNQLLNYIAKIKNAPNEVYNVRLINKRMNIYDKQQKQFNLYIGLISAVSLLVGGIVIMNIMLVSVTERTREIGIRKALGARNSDIVFQFLIESVTLTVLGGIWGIVLGYLCGKITELTTNIPAILDIKMIIISLLISIGIGIIFGIYPAYKAAKLNPIDALRFE